MVLSECLPLWWWCLANEGLRDVAADTNCVFEVDLENVLATYTNVEQLVVAAMSLYNTCVNVVPLGGGTVDGIGKSVIFLDLRLRDLDVFEAKGTDSISGSKGLHHAIKMRVWYNEGYMTRCINPPPSGPPIRSCYSLRNALPWQGQPTFGPRTTPNMDINTPHSVQSGKNLVNTKIFTDESLIDTTDDGRCAFTIDLMPGESESDIASWESIYEVVTEMEAKCASMGLSAESTLFGKHRGVWNSGRSIA